MRRKSSEWVLSSCLTCLLFSAPTLAQSFTGAIVGVVTDQSANPIANARVVAIDDLTNVVTTMMTDGEGNYSFPALRAGQYRLEIEASGFRKLVRSGVEVQVNARLRLEMAMEVGQVSDSVNVSGGSPLVESESGSLGSVIDNRKITNLPLNTRNPFQLALLSPGVVPGSNFGDAFNNSANFRINGARGNSSEMLIDGITNSVPAANPILVVAMFPSPDALQEFKVQTNSYAAEYGRSGGGVVNMVIKSGTNQFHGVAYEFLRNSAMDANDFFANKANRPLGSFKRNQFGGSLGGPVIRDRAFFFVNYEGLRQRSLNTFTGTVPTEAERRGDFSQSRQRVGANCVPVQIYDPFTTRTVNNAPVRDPFVNNVIPENRMDAVGKKIVTFFPLPNTAGDACTGANNFFSSKTTAVDVNLIDIKLDWSPDSANKFTAGLSWRTRDELAPNHYGNIADTRITVGDKIPSKGLRLEYNRTQSSTFLITARFGVTRLERVNAPNTPEGFSLNELGFPSSLEAQMTRPVTFPVFNYGGAYAPMGRGSAFLDQSGTSYTFAGSANKTSGAHNLKFGIDYRINQSSEAVGISSSGNYTFDRRFTQGPNPNQPANDRGNAVAALLLGVASAGQGGILPGVLTSNPYAGFYAQDDWKATRKLTLNLGLRYDLEPGRTERFNKLSYFDFDAPSPIAQQAGIPGLRGGLRFIGVDGNPKRQFDTDGNNFGPRFSLAYSVNEKTVVRAGYGIFYYPFVGAASGWASGINGFLSFTDMVSSIDGLRPTDLLSNPFPAGLQQPTAPGSGLLTGLGQDFGASGRDGAVDRTNRVGYSQQWNLNIQREAPGNLSVEVAYTGNRGVKLVDGPLGHQINQLTVEQLRPGAQLQQTVPNPFFGIINTGPLSRATTTRGQLLRPYPQFLGVYNFRPSSGSSIYHAFQMRVDKRFSNGLTLLASYTNSKLIEDATQAVGFLGAA